LSAGSPPTTELQPADDPQGAPALPRLLSGIAEHRAMPLGEHLAVHGPLPAMQGGRGRRGRHQCEELIEEIAAAGLLGKGGAGFPAAAKLRAVAGARGKAIVVANGAEGEPGSLKDRTLMEMLPHLILDGALVAAVAVAAEEIVIGVCETATESRRSMAMALQELASSGAGSQRSPAPVLVPVPAHYVAGQETALLNWLGGGAAKPTFTPPLPFEAGLRRRPTLLSNVETLAHMGLIARHGADWFRQLGTPAQPGSALVTVSGPVAHPGVYEIEHGCSLSSLLSAAGGLQSNLSGALLGGHAGSWIAASELQGVALSGEHLAPLGATLGAGVVALLSGQACPVAETARLARWLSGQSAQQCGPCVHGLDALARTLEEIAGGMASAGAQERLQRLSALVTRRGACHHPDGAASMVLSALDSFPDAFAEHTRHGRCQGCLRPPELPMPDRPVVDETLRQRGART
jgi:NADH:ubiquinone oxidoreductase subunit F (NADH-binding)